MTLIDIIKRKLKNNTNNKVKAGSGSGGDCGPGMHRHGDVYHDKCHPISQHHRHKDYKPKRKEDGDATRKIPKPKKLKLKKLQLGRPL